MNKKLLTLSSLALTSFAATAQNDKNVLFILVDDMQLTALEKLGDKTPGSKVINELMANSTKFSNCYTQGSLGGALSMPSRAMIMTGRTLYETTADGMTIHPHNVTIPETLRKEGYRTFATGKWHSDYKSFNRSFSEGENIYFGGMHQYSTGGHQAPYLKHYQSDTLYNKQKSFVGDKFSSEMFADATVDFLKSAGKNKENPFFAYVAFTSPHDPHDKLPQYSSPTSTEIVTLPENYAPQHPFDNGELDVRDETVVPTPRTKEIVIEQNQWYSGMINEVGQQIGRLLDELKNQGLDENTIIVFASDNGLAMGRHGLMGKQSLYEHSISVPMSIYIPGNKPKVNDGLCYLSDINPTLYSLLEVEKPESVTTEVLPMKGTKTNRYAIALSYSSIQRAVVWKNFKYIIYKVDGVVTKQLFDLKNDPFEMTNLAENKKYAKMVAQYHDKLNVMMKENNDFCDLSNPKWWGDGHKITWNEGLKLIK